MICQECNERPASYHFTKIVNGEKTVLHLCDKCAQEKGELYMMNASAFSLNNLLAGLLNNIEIPFKQTHNTPFYQDDILHCKNCLMTYQQFIKTGRFGCSECYESFSEQLIPIIRKLQNGNWTHNGKIPKRIGGNIHIRKNIEELKQTLRELVAREEFENAAKVRDQIKMLERQLEDLNSGGGF